MKRSKMVRGFSLIEVTIVMLIGGLILASISAMLIAYIKKTNLYVTRERLETIDQALQEYLSLNGRYPCPASLSVAPDTPGYGFEQASTPGLCDSAPVVAGRNGRNVRLGAVPVRSLGLPDDFISDAWAVRFTYAVTEALAQSGTFDSREGGLQVLDSADNNIAIDPTLAPGDADRDGTAHYVIVSHGENELGGTPEGGGAALPCPAAPSLEAENCDGDASFRSTIRFSSASGSAYFDDLVYFRSLTAFGPAIPEGAVLPFNMVACPDGWVPFVQARGRFIVGAETGRYDLGDTGGQEAVALSEDETGVTITGGLPTDEFPGGTIIVPQVTGTTTAHENRPPFVALQYCEKT